MISVVCVSNDADVLENRLLRGLRGQTAPVEEIIIENGSGDFRGGAAALNHGARQATGKWLLFAHQDVLLLGQDWLARVGQWLDRWEPAGWVGAAGVDASGKAVGLMLDRASFYGAPFAGLREVQTLDECLLIHKNDRADGRYFDESVPGWHAYGVEACCAAIREGKRNYVVPVPIWHDSKSTNLAGLAEAHQYVWRKHGAELGRIHTTCGTLPDLYEERQAPRLSPGDRARGYLRSAGLRLAGEVQIAERWFEEELEVMTEGQARIDCLHGKADADALLARAFTPLSKALRSVKHLFCGLKPGEADAPCVVIARELTDELLQRPESLAQLKTRSRMVLACIELDACWKRPLAFRSLLRQMESRRLTYSWDGKPVLIAVV